MENINLDISHLNAFISSDSISLYRNEAMRYNRALYEKTGEGKDFLGWVKLPNEIDENQFKAIEETAQKLKEKAQIVVAIGIGGSYLGAKAVIEALSHSFSHLKQNDAPLVLFAGQNIGEDYLDELREVLKERDYALIAISKSGTTTEPAIAFRILRNDLEEKYGKEDAKHRIVAITDKEKGALRQLANDEGYTTFVIPDDVGGRFSVLTPVGLLPIAVAGFDVRQMVEGAKTMEVLTDAGQPFEKNMAALYAASRNALYKEGKIVELLINYHPKLQYFAEWWKQLYGESEGKQHKGIFPASANFTTDLHSLGQYIQDGKRHLFETVLTVKNAGRKLTIPEDNDNLDKLNYLAGKRIDYVNKMAELGTRIAHIDGSVPNMIIEIPELNVFYIGQLIYFFEKACGISGYMLGVNPFDQPGVEAYKRNMFALLGKAGFEKEGKAIREKLKKKE